MDMVCRYSAFEDIPTAALTQIMQEGAAEYYNLQAAVGGPAHQSVDEVLIMPRLGGTLWKAAHEQLFIRPGVFQEMVAAKLLGRKTGGGFYAYPAAPKGAKISLNMELQAVTKPRQSMEAADLAAAILQCEAAIRSKAGVLGFAAPKVKRIVFRGAVSGLAVNAAGVSRPLPIQTGHPAYDPEQMPGVTSLQFTRPPLALLLAGRT